MRLNPFLLLDDTDAGCVRYAVRAWLIAVVPALALFLARIATGAATFAPPPGTLDLRLAGYSIVVAPVIETALMLALAWLIARAIPGRRGVRIVTLATLFALAHGSGGGWVQAVIVIWPSLVYSAILLAWWPRSHNAAFALTALVHALYNATFYFIAGIAGIAGS
jgi:hypothetical protein